MGYHDPGTCEMWAGKEDIRAILRHEGVEPVPVNFVGVLNACASVAALEEGKGIHEQIVKCGFESDFLWLVAS